MSATPSSTFRERLARGERLVGDGGLGTMLMARGLSPGESPEGLNLTRPEVVEEVARLYAEAGADLVTTNTFGGSPARLAEFGLDEQTEAINAAAVAAARRGVAGRALVSGSMGPSGRMLAPLGDADPEDLRAGYLRQALALAAAGVDLFCIETMMDVEEARLAVSAAREAAPAVPIIATMTFEPSRRGFHTIMGTPVADAARLLQEAGADVVGSNCGNGIETMVLVAQAFAGATRLPIAIQANAGLPQTEGGQLVYAETAEMFAAAVPALVAAGVAIIGGCCGTTPDHVRAVRAALSRAAASSR
jgi:5-methyltetrahydrofolate--homocysteine methyltransferase